MDRTSNAYLTFYIVCAEREPKIRHVSTYGQCWMAALVEEGPGRSKVKCWGQKIWERNMWVNLWE